MPKKIMDDVLTAKEAARYVRLTLPTFYRYIWERKIEAPKIGARYRFTKALLDRRVTAIKRDGIMAQIDVDIGSHKITAVIIREALDPLGHRIGEYRDRFS